MASRSTSSHDERLALPLLTYNRCIVLFSIFILAATNDRRVVAWDPHNCSQFCRCLWLYGLRWADCTGHRLYSVETGVDQAVQALDLSNNSVSALANYELRDAGLTRLKLLNLSSNAINTIGLTAFADLSELRVLDLSGNHLYSILPDTFVANKRLEVLELAGNNLNQRVPKLRSSSLGSLDLSNCGIGHLPSNTFDGLPRLRALDLTDNMMIQLELNILKGLPNIAVLMIERNPWSCNNNMYELQKRLRARRIDFKRVCNESKSPDSNSVSKQKSEKMIAPLRRPVMANTERASDRLLVKVKNWKNSLKGKSTSSRCQTSGVTAPSNVHFRHNSSIYPGLATISPFCFIAIGFLVGSAISTIFTYLWLARTLRRSRLELRRARGNGGTEASEIANQRVNLLQHLCQSNEDAARSMIECPGTPPPPYRDVVLHASRYPRTNFHSTLIYGTSESNVQ